MDPFATLDELKGRLDWTLDADEERAAVGALEDASELARGYGLNWPDPARSPRLVRTLVLQCVKRYMQNPEGFTTSRAGDETVSMPDNGAEAGGVFFTDREIKLIQALAGTKGLYTVPISAYQGGRRQVLEGFVPDADGTKPFPMFGSDTDPW